MKRCIKMYEYKYKNISITNLADLNSFLNLIAALNEPLELFAIGGTAMVLKNIKESTKDIDFLTTEKYEKIKRMFNLAGLKEEAENKMCNIWRLNQLRIDIFYDGFIIGIPFPKDWKKLSVKIKEIGKISLYILNWYDLIITKILHILFSASSFSPAKLNILLIFSYFSVVKKSISFVDSFIFFKTIAVPPIANNSSGSFNAAIKLRKLFKSARLVIEIFLYLYSYILIHLFI